MVTLKYLLAVAAAAAAGFGLSWVGVVWFDAGRAVYAAIGGAVGAAVGAALTGPLRNLRLSLLLGHRARRMLRAEV